MRHLKESSSVYGTVFHYIALRMLGFGPDHPDIVRARINLHKKRLFPTWMPGHISTFWCHGHHAILVMSYCFANHVTMEEDELIQSLRQVMGSQTWDASFIVQGFLEAGIHNNPDNASCLKNAHAFLKSSQGSTLIVLHTQPRKWWDWSVGETEKVKDNPPNYQKYYRQMNKESSEHCPVWDRANTNGISQLLKGLGKRAKILDHHSRMLDMRNSDGGFATCETKRGTGLLEVMNSSDIYGDCMVDYTYLECSASVMLALKYFQKKYPEHRADEIRDTLNKALQFCRNMPRADGSWCGVACKEVTTACKFLVSKQMKDGGWGEEFESFRLRKCIKHTISQIHQTAWALLGLMAARYPDVKILEKGIEVLIDRQSSIGDWPQGDIITGFYKSGVLHYDAYRIIFPILALAHFVCLYSNSPVARHLLNGGAGHLEQSLAR